MKRAALTLGLTALLATPAAAQWWGEPVWKQPQRWYRCHDQR